MAEKAINGRHYRFEPLPAWEAWDLLQLLLDVIGPMSDVIEAVLADEADRNAQIARAAGLAIRKRNQPAMRQLIQKLIESCMCEGQPCVIGVKPQSLDEMFQVALWAGEVQFSGFFGGGGVSKLGALIGKAMTTSE